MAWPLPCDDQDLVGIAIYEYDGYSAYDLEGSTVWEAHSADYESAPLPSGQVIPILEVPDSWQLTDGSITSLDPRTLYVFKGIGGTVTHAVNFNLAGVEALPTGHVLTNDDYNHSQALIMSQEDFETKSEDSC